MSTAAADIWLAALNRISDERDRARGTAAALEAENARLLTAVEQVQALRSRWENALGDGCPSCGPNVDFCDHIEGYHHAYTDLRAALVGLGGEGEG